MGLSVSVYLVRAVWLTLFLILKWLNDSSLLLRRWYGVLELSSKYSGSKVTACEEDIDVVVCGAVRRIHIALTETS